MPTKKKQIDTLLKSSKKRIVIIEKIITKSVKNNKFYDELDIEFKNFLDELKSALDYCANDISEKYAIGIVRKVYFPIKASTKTLHSGRDIKLWEIVKVNNRPLYDYLENIQQNIDKEFIWLKEFNNLVVENKHKNFTIKWLNSSNRIKFKTNAGTIDWDEKAVNISGIIKSPVEPIRYTVGSITIGDMVPIRWFCNLSYKNIQEIIEGIYKLF
jgi:hypothetical protein